MAVVLHLTSIHILFKPHFLRGEMCHGFIGFCNKTGKTPTY